MYNKELYNKLKQTNVSKDQEKTKERVKAVWSTLGKQQKQEIFNISDLKKATLERTCRLGNISVILATALAEVARIDPYYLTAETDEKQENISDSTIESFLIDHNYKNVIDETQQTVYYRHDYSEGNPYMHSVIDKQADAEVVESASSGAIIPLIASNILGTLTEDDKTSLESMTEDDMLYLLKAINLRARFNTDAKSKTLLLKKILIE